MGSAAEVLVVASTPVGEALKQTLDQAQVPARALDLVHPVYSAYRFDPKAWDGLVLGSIHAWRGLRPEGIFEGPCFAVGERTADRLRAEAGELLRGPLLVPERQHAEGLVELVRRHFGEELPQARVLIPRTARGRTVIQDALGAEAHVEAACVYEMRFASWPEAESDLAGAWALVAGSGEILRRVVDRVGAIGLEGRQVFVFGPSALQAAAELGLKAEAPDQPSAAAVGALVAARARME